MVEVDMTVYAEERAKGGRCKNPIRSTTTTKTTIPESLEGFIGFILPI